MSRIGKQPIPIPDGVEVLTDNGVVRVKGPKGELELRWNPGVDVTISDNAVIVSRPDDAPTSRALHGLTRSLIANMVTGVVTPYEKRLEIVGVGYQAQVQGKELALSVGFKNTVMLPIPELVDCEVAGNVITLRSVDKQVVGQFAATIRAVRPPEPYKGKGIRYQDEHVRRKAGKAFAK